MLTPSLRLVGDVFHFPRRGPLALTYHVPIGGSRRHAALSFAPAGATYTSLIICPGGGSRRHVSFHIWHVPSFRISTFGMYPTVGIDDHIIPRLHFGPAGLHVAFGFDLTAPLARVWLWRIALFGIGVRIVPLRAFL